MQIKSLLQHLFLALSMLLTSVIYSQTVDLCPEVPAGPFTSGQTITIPVIATGITDIIGLQLFLAFDEQDVSFSSGTSVEAAASDFNAVTPGEIRMVYTDPQVTGITYPDGTAFFTLTFTADTDIPFMNLNILATAGENALEAVGLDANTLPTTYCGEPINDGQAGNNFELTMCTSITDGPINAGDAITGQSIFWSGFNEVTSFTYLLQYNAALLQYNEWVAQVELGPGLTISEPNPGQILVSWVNDTPLSLVDGAGLITFNFSAIQTSPNPNLQLLVDEGNATVTFLDDVEGTYDFCDGSTFDPDNFVDFCPDNPAGPFTTDEIIEIPIRVNNFVGMVVTGLPLRFDANDFTYVDVQLDLPNDVAAISVETLPDGGLRTTLIDWDESGIVLADDDILFTVRLAANQDVDAVNLEIDPTVGDFYTSRDIEITQQQPVTACDLHYLGYILANVNVTVFQDEQNNCSGIPTGDPLLNWIVTFTNDVTNQEHSASVGEYGNAYLSLPVGNYTYEWHAPGNPELWDNCVPMPFEVTDTTNITEVDTATVGVLAECSEVAVTISSFNLRPCFENNTFVVDYYNQGTAVAEDAYIDVIIEQAFVPNSSTLPYTDLGGGTYRFELGDLAPNESGFFWIAGQIDCDYPVGASLCASATIYPYETDCSFDNPSFGGGELKVSAQCDGDSVRFLVENVGSGPTGEISLTIIEDVVIYMSTPIDLEFGESMPFSVPANGRTYRLETDLPEFAPYLSQGLDISEACGTLPGGGFSSGLVNGFSLLDGDLWLDRYCQQTSAAYDPNDKQAIPAGVGPDNDILPNQTMDYKIRFQNTGTDTAFTVVVRDTIDTSVLNINTLSSGSSSHPYRLNIEGNELIFTFENILLVDSLTNEAASHGFVHFSIAQQPDLADGTIIENIASIYFDFNDPIVTEPSRQTIDRNLLPSRTVNFQAQGAAIPVYPSPTNGLLNLDLSEHHQSAEVIIYDVFGRQLIQRNLAGGSRSQLDLTTLPSGRYAYRLLRSGQLIQTGVVVKE
ncbi:hypothetical protein CEQ90_10255 [Lewinellaceae bacterium SD302]|nr:hypothetical protein CEQ90_10255 [Lewinellaceae bacterium SD302]